MQLRTLSWTKLLSALSALALGIAAAGCGGSQNGGGGSVAKALASNPPASVQAAPGGGQAGLTALLDPRAIPPLPSGGRVAVPVLVLNRGTSPAQVHLAVTLNSTLTLSGAQPALPGSGAGSGWSCDSSGCTYLQRAANGSTGPAHLPPGGQLSTMVVVGTSSHTPTGATPGITVSPSGTPGSGKAQSAHVKVVPAAQARPALVLGAAGTSAGVTPGGQAVARYQVVNGGSAAISPGSLTLSGVLPRGFTKGWTVTDRNWNCQSSSDQSAPSCRLRTGVAVGAQAPELVMAYRVASHARGNQSWTAEARAASAHGNARAATARLPLSADVQDQRAGKQPTLHGVPGPGPELSVGATPGDTLRRGGYSPLEVTILDGGDTRLRAHVRVRIHLPSGLKATGAGAPGWSCGPRRGQTVACRRRTDAKLAVNAATSPITVWLSVARGATGAEPITVDAKAGAVRGSTTIRPVIEGPFTVQASALPSVITNAPSRAMDRLRLVQASTGGLDSQEGILTATPSDPHEPGVQYVWHQDCTRSSDLRVRGCTRLVPRVTWLVPSRHHDAIGQSVRYIAPNGIPGSALRFTVTVTGAGSPARATTTVRVIRNEASVWAPQPRPEVRESAPMRGYRQINLEPGASNASSTPAVQPVDPGPRPDNAGVAAYLRRHRTLVREYRARPLAPLPRADSSTMFCTIFDAATHGDIRNLALRADLSADFLGVSTSGSDCTDPTAQVTFGGQSALRVGTGFTLDRISGTITSGGVSITTATLTAPSDWATLPFTLPSGSQLQIPFGDGSAVQPLAGVITSPTFAILPLVPPMGISGTHTTDLTFGDTVTGGQRISIAGTAAADSASAELRGPIALDGTFDISGSENGIFNAGDCSMNVAGKLRRTAAGGPISKDLTGTMATCHPLGNVTLSNATGTWTDGAVQLDATGSVDGPGGRNLALKVGGKIASLSKWSLSVSTADGFMWKPAAFLSITKIGGSLARADGKTTFSLDGEVGSWKVNDNLVFGQSKVRITNECSPGVQCETGLARVLFDLSGKFYPRYAISYDLHLDFTAQGSVEIPSGAISIAAQPSLGPIPFGEFKLKNPKLGLADAGPAADGSGAHTLAVTLTASVSFWGKELDVHGEFSANGYWFLASLGSWSPSSKYPELFGLKDANIVYSSYDQPDRKFGESGREYTMQLKAGAPQIGASYPIPTLIDTLFGGKLKYGWLTADISFSDKITFTGTIHFRTDEPDIYLLGSSGSLIALKAKIPYLKVGIVQGGEPTIGIADNVSFVYPKFSGGETGSIDLTLAADLSLKSKSISGSISNTTGWDPFMGITGFAIHQFAIQVDYTPGTAPSYGIAGTVSFPDWLNTGLNLTHNTKVSLAMKLNPSEPCLAMGVENSDKTKDAIDLLNAHVITAKSAGFVLAPKGCDIGAISYPRGASFNLDSRMFGVDVKFNARVQLEDTFVMEAHAAIGAFSIGNVVKLEKTTLDLDIDTGFRKKFNIEFSGGVSVPGATAHVDGKLNAHDGVAALELHGLAEGTKLGEIQVPGRAKFDLSATADLGTIGALKTIKTTMDADMKVLGNGIHMHFDLDYANYDVRKMSASQETSFGIPSVASLSGKVMIGYEGGKGSAGYEGKIEAFGFPLFRTAGKLDARLDELAVDADLVDLRSPWIGIYLVNFRASVNIHLTGNLSLSKLNVGAEGRAEIEGEVCYIISCSSFGSIGVNPGFNFNPFKIKICASIPVIGWQCLEIGGGSSPGPPPPPPPPKPIVGLPTYLAPGSLIRMYTDQGGWHIVTRGGSPLSGVSGGAVDWTTSPYDRYSYEGTLGFVDPGLQPGEVELWSCYNGTDQYVSRGHECNGTHQYNKYEGFIGGVWPTKPSGDGLEYREILRCLSGGRDHFVTYADKNCEGTQREISLGWIAQSQPRLELYIAKDGTRTTTSRAVLADVGAPAGTVGFLLPKPGPGRQALYSCQRPNDNKPRFLTPQNDCQGFANMLGIEGWDWTSPAPAGQLPRTKITQCYTELAGHKINYVLKLGDDIGDCIAQRDLGYIDDTQPGLDEYSDGTRHWVSTRAVPAQYQFQGRLGYLFQSSGNGRIPLYSCLKGVGDFQTKDTALKDVQQFLSRDPNCDRQYVQGIAGWVSPTRPAAASYQLFLCSYGRDRFVWINAGCDGKQREEELGWDSQTPTTSG